MPGTSDLQGAYRAVPFRGAGNRPEAPMIPTGRPARRRAIAASVSRLDGSAHCRSSAPTTTGPDSARASTRSPNASTTRN